MSAKVFISYSSEDRDVATKICDALETRGVKCWIASRDVGPGENFQESIVKTIRDANVMVLVFTGNANNSDEIKKELALASQNKLAIIPVRMEDVVPNDAFEYEFATRQWVDLFQDWEQEIERLSSSIANTVADPEARGEAPTEAKAQVAATSAPPDGARDTAGDTVRKRPAASSTMSFMRRHPVASAITSFLALLCIALATYLVHDKAGDPSGCANSEVLSTLLFTAKNSGTELDKTKFKLIEQRVEPVPAELKGKAQAFACSASFGERQVAYSVTIHPRQQIVIKITSLK